MRVVIPTGLGCVMHLFVVYGFQGAEHDPEKLALTNRLLDAVLAEAQVGCVGQQVPIVGDFNAEAGVIPCFAKGLSAGGFVDLSLAYSVGAGVEPDMTCRFK